MGGPPPCCPPAAPAMMAEMASRSSRLAASAARFLPPQSALWARPWAPPEAEAGRGGPAALFRSAPLLTSLGPAGGCSAGCRHQSRLGRDRVARRWRRSPGSGACSARGAARSDGSRAPRAQPTRLAAAPCCAARRAGRLLPLLRLRLRLLPHLLVLVLLFAAAAGLLAAAAAAARLQLGLHLCIRRRGVHHKRGPQRAEQSRRPPAGHGTCQPAPQTPAHPPGPPPGRPPTQQDALHLLRDLVAALQRRHVARARAAGPNRPVPPHARRHAVHLVLLQRRLERHHHLLRACARQPDAPAQRAGQGGAGRPAPAGGPGAAPGRRGQRCRRRPHRSTSLLWPRAPLHTPPPPLGATCSQLRCQAASRAIPQPSSCCLLRRWCCPPAATSGAPGDRSASRRCSAPPLPGLT
jgi:hypothetical protein